MFSSNIVHRRINDFQHTFLRVLLHCGIRKACMKWETAQSRQEMQCTFCQDTEMNYLHQKLSTINQELLGNISVHPRTLSLLFNSDANKKR